MAPQEAPKETAKEARKDGPRDVTKDAAKDAREQPEARRVGCGYVVQFGNNSSMVRNILRSRPWWTSLPGDPSGGVGIEGGYDSKQVLIANPEPLRAKRDRGGEVAEEAQVLFLWSQYRCKPWMKAMATGSSAAVSLNKEKDLEVAVWPRQQFAGVYAHNHVGGMACLTTKCKLVSCMRAFCASKGKDCFDLLPLTLLVERVDTPEFEEFQRVASAIDQQANDKMWIVKPAENSNRGFGIQVCATPQDVEALVRKKPRPLVVQKYIEQPLLIQQRKFDIRAYCLVVMEPELRAYTWPDAYLRTASRAFSKTNLDKFIHLNNDAVQNKGEDYGKFEPGNKLSFTEFERYLQRKSLKSQERVAMINKRVEAAMADAISAAAGELRKGEGPCFEILGFDFMVDQHFHVWMIEVNTNPCLELSNAFLSYLIPHMVEDAIELGVERPLARRGLSNREDKPVRWKPLVGGDGPPLGEMQSTLAPACDDLAEAGRAIRSRLKKVKRKSAASTVSSATVSTADTSG